MIYGCTRHPMVSAAARPVCKFTRSADDVVTVLGLHSGGAHEARFLSIRDAGKFRFPRHQDMAMARLQYHRAGSLFPSLVAQFGISKRRNLNLSIHHGDIRPRTICA
jgi:hypothetical protein